MGMVSNITTQLDGWINPFVVKELRQAVQGRFVVGILLLFLLVCVSAMGLYAMQYEEGLSDFNDGRDMFMFFWGALVVAGCALIPLNVMVRLSKEIEANQTELLFTTTLSSGTIIRGKLFSAFVLSVLIYTACLPFMTLTFLMRGIDVVSIFMLLIYGLIIVALMVQFAIFIGCFPVSKAFKLFFGLFIIVVIGYCCVGTIASAYELLRNGFFSRLGSWQYFWMPTSIFVATIFSLGGLFYMLSVALISPVSSNRALPVRLYLTIIWLISGSVLGYVVYTEKIFWPLLIWAITTTFVMVFGLLISISERESLGARMRKQIPDNWLLRIPMLLLYSGAAGGVLWCLSLFVLTVTTIWSVYALIPSGYAGYSDVDEVVSFMCTWIFYFLGYGMLAVLVRRITWSSFGWRLRPTWAIAMCIMIIFMIIPLMIGFFSGANLMSRKAWVWYLSTPLSSFAYQKHIDTYLAISIAFAVVTTLLNLPWFYKQIANFKPLPPVTPKDDTETSISDSETAAA